MMCVFLTPARKLSKQASTFGGNSIVDDLRLHRIARRSWCSRLRVSDAGSRRSSQNAGRVGQEHQLLHAPRLARKRLRRPQRCPAFTFSRLPSVSMASDGMARTTPAAQKSPLVRSASTSRRPCRRKAEIDRPTLGIRQRQLGAEEGTGSNRGAAPRPRPPGSGSGVRYRGLISPSSTQTRRCPRRGVIGVAAAENFARWDAGGGHGVSIGLPPPWTRIGWRPTVSMKMTILEVAAWRPDLPSPLAAAQLG